MKRILALPVLSALALLLSSCGGNRTPGSSTVPQSAKDCSAQKWLDYYKDEELPWDTSRDLELPEYPGVIFRWTDSAVTAVEDGSETTLFFGMPVWNVYLCDLTGDSRPELCATVSMGSGIVDEHIVVYDYASKATYELSDRMKVDYVLTMKEDRLEVLKSEYGGSEISTGQLVFVPEGDGHLALQGETDKFIHSSSM